MQMPKAIPGFTQKQSQIIAYNNVEKPIISILEGAVRTGKTKLDNALWIEHIERFRGQGKKFIMTGYTIPSLKKNVLDDIEEQFGVKCNLNAKNEFRLLGNTMCCFGTNAAHSHKAIRGFTSYGWYGNEIALSHANCVDECFKRCSGSGFRIFWDTNPDYPFHPIKVNYIDKSGQRLSSGRVHIRSYHFVLDDNEFLSPEYVESIKRTIPPGVYYDRGILGLWVAAEGIVYPGFNPSIHIIKPFKIPRSWEIVRGIDFGYTNPFVCLWAAVDPDGRLYFFKEHYKTQTIIKYHAEYIKQVKLWKQPSWTVADWEAEERADLEYNGVSTIPANKNVHIGIQKVAERLVVQPDGKPRIFFFQGTCPHTVREFYVYCWADTKGLIKEEPIKENDHCMDPVRYMVMQIDQGCGGVSSLYG